MSPRNNNNCEKAHNAFIPQIEEISICKLKFPKKFDFSFHQINDVSHVKQHAIILI